MAQNPLKKIRSAAIAIIAIMVSTVMGVIIAEHILIPEGSGQSVKSDVSRLEHWLGAQDIFIVAAVIGVVVLLALAFFVRHRA